MPNLVSPTKGSTENKGISTIEEKLYKHEVGKVVISNRDSANASAIIITDEGVKITNLKTTSGISIDDGVNFQGVVLNTSKSENIRKGEYSENPKSSKMFTYRETVLFESIPKELSSEVIGRTTGLNTGIAMDGVIPIITDFSFGPLPHVHTITMKHVHRVEPAYLYRVPSAINLIKGALSQLTQFFSI